MPEKRTRVMIGTDEAGQPIYKRLKANSENEMNDRIVKAYIESGRIWEFLTPDVLRKNGTHTLFRTFTEDWMLKFKKGKVKPRTYQTYELSLSGQIYPFFGDRYIEDITVADVQQFLNERSSKAEHTLKNWFEILKQIFSWAQEEKIITDNPTVSRMLVIPSHKKTERQAFTQEQLASVIKQLYTLENSPEKLLLSMLLFTGMRRSEVLGLQWEDIDFETEIIHVRRAVKHLQNNPIMEDMTTKTENGIRDIPFGKHLAQLILPMKSTGYLFGGCYPLTHGLYRSLRKRLFSQVNLYGMTEHCIRHSYLTMLASENVDLKTLQTIAGHSDPNTTLRIYVHPNQEKIQKAGKTMDQLLYDYSAPKADLCSQK